MGGRCPGDRVLPDLRIVGQRLDVLGDLLLVLAVLEQRRAGGPEDRRALAVGEFRLRRHLQLAGIVPVLRHAQRRVEVLGVVADPLGGECDLVGRAVDAAVGSTCEQDVGMRERHDLLHQHQRLDGGIAGEVEQALVGVDVAAHAVGHRRQRAPAVRVEGRAERRRAGIDHRLRVLPDTRPRSRAGVSGSPASVAIPACQPMPIMSSRNGQL